MSQQGAAGGSAKNDLAARLSAAADRAHACGQTYNPALQQEPVKHVGNVTLVYFLRWAQLDPTACILRRQGMPHPPCRPCSRMHVQGCALHMHVWLRDCKNAYAETVNELGKEAGDRFHQFTNVRTWQSSCALLQQQPANAEPDVNQP